ncbi:MAG: radical SAM protein [Candidatus Aenigmatarchaeota archaeon]
MQEAMLWHKERNGIVCDLCHLRCFISKDKFGACQVRKNENNKLYTLSFEKIVDLEIGDIEKSYIFHFLPKAKTLFIATLGCNLNQNFCLEDFSIPTVRIKEMNAEELVKFAEKKNCNAISYFFTDPTISFEFVLRIAKAAHRANLKNIFVTNGFLSEEGVKKLAKYLDAASIRIKASGGKQFMKQYSLLQDPEKIFSTMKQMKKHRVFIEVANTIIPQIGDDLEECKRLAEFINLEFGSEVPFHLLQFYPSDKFPGIPMTSISVLEKCADLARAAGLRYVYISNVPKNPNQNTYCYNCREPLILRENLKVKKINLRDDRCPNCGMRISIIRK